jgi:hypothetical protein
VPLQIGISKTRETAPRRSIARLAAAVAAQDDMKHSAAEWWEDSYGKIEPPTGGTQSADALTRTAFPKSATSVINASLRAP